MLKIFKKHMTYIGLILLILGTLGTVISLIGVFFPQYTPNELVGIIDGLGSWIYWLVLVGPICMIWGGWYIYDLSKTRKEFIELIESDSKSLFKKNLRDLEYAAYKLGNKYQIMLEEKKKDWKIRL